MNKNNQILTGFNPVPAFRKRDNPIQRQTHYYLCNLPFRLSKPKRILVLDLDHTLVHANTKAASDCDFSFRINEPVEGTFYVYKRPGLEYFLSHLSLKYRIFLFTASIQSVFYCFYYLLFFKIKNVYI